MSRRPNFWSRALLALLLLEMALPAATLADITTDPTNTGSMATSTLQGMSSMLGDVNGMFSAFGSSSAQLSGLASQLSQTQQMTQGMGQQQSAFDQIKQQLQLAMTQANSCVQQASSTNYSKYYSKRPADQQDIVKSLPPSAITSVDPHCSTYGVILDAIELNKAKMTDENKKMACVTNLQMKVDQIAEAAKAPFQSLTDAATEVYQTYSQVIDTHNQIANRIADQVDGPADKDGNRDGKSGYRAELNKLKGMALELNNVLNAKPGQNSDNLAYGLVKEVEDLKQQRASAANKWYFSLMQDVEACYQNDPAPCFDNNISMPPNQCISAVIQNNATGPDATAGMRARANDDTNNGLANIGIQNYENARDINLPANIDVSQPDQFLSFTQTRFNTTLQGVVAAYGSHQFYSSIDQGKLVNFVQAAYQACYNKATATFKSDMISKGGRYYQDVQNVQDAERNASNDEKNWIDRVEGEMTTFRTMFTQVYSSDLAQFKSDCTASEDPYTGLDCLRVLDAELQSGMRGTKVTAKLSNGTNFVSAAGETTLPVQTLTLGADGKPTIGSSSVQCSGFDDCISYLDRARDQHGQAAQQATTDRGKFVDQHNQAVKSSFQVVAAEFGQISQLVTAAVAGINTDLGNLGVSAQVKTKTVDAEQLTPDDKTGLFNMPKSMEAALAGQNAYSQIDDTSVQAVTDAYNQMLGDLNKKAADAQKMKLKCQIAKSDYEGLAKIMPNNCSDTNAVCSQAGGASGHMAQLQSLLNRSKDVPDDNLNSTSSSNDYNHCRSQVMQDDNVNNPSYDQIQAEATKMGIKFTSNTDSTYDQARSQAVIDAKLTSNTDIQQQCGTLVYSQLESLAGQDRPPLNDQNMKIVGDLEDVSQACANVTPDATTHKIAEDDSVTSACQAFKDAANSAKPPTGEEETNLAAGNKTNTSNTNPFTTTAPAK